MPNKEKIQSMFDGIAGSYDSLNHIMSLGVDKTWRRRSLKAIFSGNEDKALNVLDVACGTGDYSIEIASKMTEGGHLTGIDISEGMLAVMKEKLSHTSLPVPVDIVVGDCEQTPFPDNGFDRVTIGFGIRNFAHREAALKEILRILKPGGKLVILELSVPSNPILKALYNVYFKGIMPWIGGLVSSNKAAYRYLPASVIAFPGKEKWMQTMQECGFKAVTHKSYSFGLCRQYTGEK